MPAFSYKALDKHGKTQKGSIQAESLIDARSQVRQLQLFPIEVVLAEELTTKRSLLRPFSRQSLGIDTLVLFTRQLAILLKAGFPLVEALNTVIEQAEKNKYKNILIAISGKVQEGYPLYQALKAFPKAFPALYTQAVMAGEQSGRLEAVLVRLADYWEERQALQQKILQALLYPSLILCVSFGIVIFLLTYVVPSMVDVFSTMQQDLPLLTRLLLAVSGVIKHQGIWIALFFITVGFIAKSLLKQPQIHFAWQGFWLTVPGIGGAIRLVNLTRYVRTLGMLSSAGVPIIDAMHQATSLVSNFPMQKKLMQATRQVREGAGIFSALKQTQLFTPLTLHLIYSGEMSGKLAEQLEYAGQQQELRIKNILMNFMTLFEPGMILIMGSVVLLIVLAILLPIFSMEQIV